MNLAKSIVRQDTLTNVDIQGGKEAKQWRDKLRKQVEKYNELERNVESVANLRTQELQAQVAKLTIKVDQIEKAYGE